MTDRFYGTDVGDSAPSQVTQDSSTTSKAIELTVAYDGAGVNKNTLLNALEGIANHIKVSDWPPA